MKEIESIDIEKSKLMYEKRKKLDELLDAFEEEQKQFIDEIMSKYNITNRQEIKSYSHLLPESASKFETLSYLSHLERQIIIMKPNDDSMP